jgi:hypothetical protein
MDDNFDSTLYLFYKFIALATNIVIPAKAGIQ